MVGTAVLLAGVAPHSLGGGLLPGAVVLVVLWAACVAASGCLIAAWARPRRLVLVVVAAQSAVHALLSLVAGHRGDPVSGGAGAPEAPATAVPAQVSGNLQDAFEAQSAAVPAGQDVLLHQWQHLTEQGPLMLLAHVLGALALGLFLAHAESVLCALLVLTISFLVLGVVAARTWLRPAPLAPTATIRPITPRDVVVAPQLLDHTRLPRRGPPVLLAA